MFAYWQIISIFRTVVKIGIGYHITEEAFEDGKVKRFINISNNYILMRIYVYDGKFNYE